MVSDFLVIGSGIAGLSFALRAAEHGSVTVLTKGKALDSNTAWAQGGISAVLDPKLRAEGDSFEQHVADTLDAGAGLCKESVVRDIVGEGTATIDELLSYGVVLPERLEKLLFDYKMTVLSKSVRLTSEALAVAI